MSGMRTAIRVRSRLLVWYRLCQLCVDGFDFRDQPRALVDIDRNVDRGRSFLLVARIQFRFFDRDATLAHAI